MDVISLSHFLNKSLEYTLDSIIGPAHNASQNVATVRKIDNRSCEFLCNIQKSGLLGDGFRIGSSYSRVLRCLFTAHKTVRIEMLQLKDYQLQNRERWSPKLMTVIRKVNIGNEWTTQFIVVFDKILAKFSPKIGRHRVSNGSAFFYRKSTQATF